MTNSEAIKDIVENIKPVAGGKSLELAIIALQENTRLNGELKSEREWRFNARVEIIDKKTEIEVLLEENTKLKAENDEWEKTVEYHRKKLLEFNNDNADLKAKIEQLKAELEQSVIQCTHGYDKRQNEIGETLIFCEHTDNWMNVTLGECLGNCEAEQALQSEV